MNGIMNEVAVVFWMFFLNYPNCLCSLDRGGRYAYLSLFLNDADIKADDVMLFVKSRCPNGPKMWVNDDPKSHFRVLHIEWEADAD